MDTPVNEFVTRSPHPRLRPYVSEYTGYRIEGAEPGVHMGLPSRSLTFIVAFDEPLDVTATIDGNDRDTYWAMLAGLHGAPALIRHDGRQHGVQLDVTPRGAAALFDVPAGALASAVVQLDAIVPSFSVELTDRLSAATSWADRWAILDEVLLRELSLEAPLPEPLEQAWSMMVRGQGLVSVADVADHVGWSRRHLAQRFTSTFGLSPKVMSRVLRFERAKGLIQAPTRPSLASVAAACGYADQAHLTREWTVFAGSAPTRWMRDDTLVMLDE
ncbi:MAG: AraC family transcriptional regulator [Microthrixaceae bacterium]|nr:AraC family transcriptional regulator [Microthrixaceae bacterium]